MYWAVKHLFIFMLILQLFWSCQSRNKKTQIIDRPFVNSVMDLAPTKKDNHHFESKDLPSSLKNAKASSMALVDLNFDGYEDLLLFENFLSAPKAYLYSRKLKTFKVSAGPFPSGVVGSYGVYFDIDGDGIKDAVVATLNQNTLVEQKAIVGFKGVKVRGLLYFRPFNFVPVSIQADPISSLVLLDFDLDGDLDVGVGLWYEKKGDSSKLRGDYILENKAGRLVKKDKLFLGESDSKNFTPTFSLSTCDVNRDGYPDILTSSHDFYPNRLWLNRKGKSFINVAHESNYSLNNTNSKGRSFQSLCFDYNNDRIPDIFSAESFKSYEDNTVLRSGLLTGRSLQEPPKYFRTPYTLDSWDINKSQSDRRILSFDGNMDGLLDLVIDNFGFPPETRLIYFEQREDHSYENVALQKGIDFVNPQSSIYLDINDDGAYDFMSFQSNVRAAGSEERLRLFVNKLRPQKSVEVKLMGKKGNEEAIGAMVELVSFKGHKRVFRSQFLHGPYGAFSPKNTSKLYFYLPKDEKPHLVRVTWPFKKNGKVYRTETKLLNKKNQKIVLTP